MAQDRLKSALATAPKRLGNPIRRPSFPIGGSRVPSFPQPGQMQPQMPQPPVGGIDRGFQLPSQPIRPFPRPSKGVPGSADLSSWQRPRPMPWPGSQPTQPPGQAVGARPQAPIFHPFPRPIQAPGQRPDMFAGGSPNFNEATGQYAPQLPMHGRTDWFYNQPGQALTPELRQQMQEEFARYTPRPGGFAGEAPRSFPAQQQMESDRRNFIAGIQQQAPAYQPQQFNPYRKF